MIEHSSCALAGAVMSVRLVSSTVPSSGQGYVFRKDMGVCGQVHLGAVRGPAHDPEPCLQVKLFHNLSAWISYESVDSANCKRFPVCDLASAMLCSFWRHVSNLERRETRRYLQMFYCLMMRPLIAKVCTLSASTFGRSWMLLMLQAAWQQILHQVWAMWECRWQPRRETWRQ